MAPIEGLQYPCIICGKRFKFAKQVGKHVEIAHLDGGDTYECEICQKTFPSSKALSKHSRVHSEEKNFLCSYCFEGFALPAQRQKHEQTHIKKKKINVPNTDALKEIPKKPKEKSTSKKTLKRGPQDKKYSCKYCFRNFSYFPHKRDHEKKHIGVDGAIKVKIEPKKKNRSRVNELGQKAQLLGGEGLRFPTPRCSTTNYRPDPAIFKNLCRVCNMEFTTPEEMKDHRNSHPPSSKTFICKICGNCCNKGSQTMHYLKHTGKRNFKCDICPMAFYQKQNLALHKRSHTKERPHVCTICGKSYTRPSSFREHMFSHTGERPYKCRYCEKAFMRYSGRQSHELTHTGEKPLECKVCHRFFAVHATLNAHVKRHFNPTSKIRKKKEPEIVKYQPEAILDGEIDEVENWVRQQLPSSVMDQEIVYAIPGPHHTTTYMSAGAYTCL